MARTPAFQADDASSILVARSNENPVTQQGTQATTPIEFRACEDHRYRS